MDGKVDEELDLLTADPDVTTDEGMQQLLRRVSVLETGNRHADAAALLDAALIKRPNSAELHNARCWYRALRNTDLDNALADCNRAIELSSDPATYLDSRALVHFRAGRLKAALTDYQAALAASPEQASALFMSRIIAGKLGDNAQARADLDAARKIFPDIDHFYQRYGLMP